MAKVLMVGQFGLPVTGEYSVNNYLRNVLQRNGFDVEVVDSCIINDVSQVGKFGFKKIFLNVHLFLKFLLHLLSNPLCIVYMTPGQTFLGLLRFAPLVIFSFLFSRKIIVHWHGYGVLGVFKKYKILSFLYFYSPRVINLLLTFDFKSKLSDIGVCVDNCRVVRNFSDISLIDEEKIVSPVKLRVLFLGSLMEEKGFYSFLEASKICDFAEFIVCGSGGFSAVALAEKFHSAGLIDYRGVVSGDQKSRAFIEADIFVLQTHYPTEGVPLTLVEAMSAGCALVTTYHNGIPETVGDAAYFVSKDSVDSLCNALTDLNDDRIRLMELKLKAYERAKIFSKDNFAQSMLLLFNSH